MKIKIKWVGSKRKFWEDMQNTIDDTGDWLEIRNVKEFEVIEEKSSQ